MAKVMDWLRKHQYQWRREDFRRYYNRLCLGLIVGMLCLVGGIVIVEPLGFADATAIIGGLIIGALYGALITIVWFDGKLKNSGK